MQDAFSVQGSVPGLPGQRTDPPGTCALHPYQAVSVLVRDQGVGSFRYVHGGFRCPAGRFQIQIVFKRRDYTVRYAEFPGPQACQFPGQHKVPGSGCPAAENQDMAPPYPVAQRLLLFFGQTFRIRIIQDDHSEAVQQFFFRRQGFRFQRHRLPVFIAVQRVVFLVDVEVRKVLRPGRQYADHHGGRVDHAFRLCVDSQDGFPVPEDFNREHFLPCLGRNRQHHGPFPACGNGNFRFKPVVFLLVHISVDRQGSFQVLPGVPHRHPYGKCLPIGNPSVIPQQYLRRQGRVFHLGVHAFRKSRGNACQQA